MATQYDSNMTYQELAKLMYEVFTTQWEVLNPEAQQKAMEQVRELVEESKNPKKYRTVVLDELWSMPLEIRSSYPGNSICSGISVSGTLAFMLIP